MLLEGLATIAGETHVTDKLVGEKGKESYVVVTASAPQNPASFHETPAWNHPAVSWTSSITEVETATRLGYSKPWRIRQPNRDSKKTDNAAISLTILAE